MVTKLIKRTIEETVDAQDEIVEKVVAIEMAILDDNGNEIGRLHVNKWGGNFNFNTGNMDVETVSDGITNILIGQ